MPWVPKRTFSESMFSLFAYPILLTFLIPADEILCAPGMLHQLESRLINGQLCRVYKHLWSSLREFWLLVSEKYNDRTYIVFEHQRWTYGQIAERSLKAASVYRHIYHIQKGDTVGICSRNFPDYLVAFWACHLIGAVPVLANASVITISPFVPDLALLDGFLLRLYIIA
jgi:non-ribosomal peptide synthetase component F